MNSQPPARSRLLTRMRPTLLAAALLTAGLHAPHAIAMGLGAIKIRSVIGEPFRAEIPLIGASEATPAGNCFVLDQPALSGQDDLPWLANARVRVQGRTIYISSPVAVSEPVLMVGLRVGCGFELAREYTVLMQPAGTAIAEERAADGQSVHGTSAETQAAIAPATPTATARARTARRTNATATPASSDQASETTAPAAPAPRPARKPRQAANPSGNDRLFVAPNIDSGTGGLKMSGGLAPRAAATEAQREALRTEQRLLAALDEQIATHLAIADKVKQLEARMAQLQQQLGRSESALDSSVSRAVPALPRPEISQAEPAAAPNAPVTAETESSSPAPTTVATEPAPPAGEAVAPPPPPGLTNEPVKVISKLPPEPAPASQAPDTPGMNWMIAALGLMAAGSVLAGAWLWRRRARKVAATAAVRQRLAADAMAGLMSDAPAPEAASWSPGAARRSPWRERRASEQDELPNIDPPPSLEAPPEWVPDRPPPGDVNETVEMPALISSHVVDIELDGESRPEATQPTRLDLEFDSFVGSASSLGSVDDAPAQTGPRLVSTNPAPSAGHSFDQSARPANEEDAPSHQHVLELAEIMMSFGRAEGAAQTLSEFLRDYPKESLIPWLKLLDLYYSSGRRGEYDDLAPKLNRAFNVKVPDWESFNGPTTAESVEQFGHIMARIGATWPNQDCLDYVNELLSDNRAGTRIGFPLGVVDDLLLLKSLLECLIASPSATSSQSSRLAII
ncbi:MAG TPA: hypothetical protein VIO81_06610 [Methyloversatilis sp.]